MNNSNNDVDAQIREHRTADITLTIFKEDQTPLANKPSYEALLSLVKDEWWLHPTKMVTDSEGKLRLNGFLGEYTLSWLDEWATFSLDVKGTTTRKVFF
jgi:hypothetical protein